MLPERDRVHWGPVAGCRVDAEMRWGPPCGSLNPARMDARRSPVRPARGRAATRLEAVIDPAQRHGAHPHRRQPGDVRTGLERQVTLDQGASTGSRRPPDRQLSAQRPRVRLRYRLEPRLVAIRAAFTGTQVEDPEALDNGRLPRFGDEPPADRKRDADRTTSTPDSAPSIAGEGATSTRRAAGAGSRDAPLPGHPRSPLPTLVRCRAPAPPRRGCTREAPGSSRLATTCRPSAQPGTWSRRPSSPSRRPSQLLLKDAATPARTFRHFHRGSARRPASRSPRCAARRDSRCRPPSRRPPTAASRAVPRPPRAASTPRSAPVQRRPTMRPRSNAR